MKNQPVIEANRKFRFRNTPETLRYFYHPDHIGSTSWVTDSAKNGIQYCEYLPFGEPFLDQRSTTWNSRYTFSGKERDNETGYNYFGARYYNSDISIWLSVDPMADKYPNLTPYAYCSNNPIVLVDPDGREWEIDGYCYTPGSQAPEEASQNTKDKWNTMNGIYSTRNGKKVIDEMNKIGVTYNVSSESHPDAKNASGSYKSNEDGTVGTIYLNGNNKSTGVLSHEMFHGYQDLQGQGGRSIHNEVEAMLFENSIVTEYNFENPAGFLGNPLKGEDAAFNHQVNKMTEAYSDAIMNSLIIQFKKYSGANSSGIYNEYPLRRDNQENNLIQNFYPLLPCKK